MLFDERRIGFFEYLLIPSLGGTLSFTTVYDLSFAIAEYLYLDMSCGRNELFDENPSIAEKTLFLEQ